MQDSLGRFLLPVSPPHLLIRISAVEQFLLDEHEELH